jgi:hypothetical protein
MVTHQPGKSRQGPPARGLSSASTRANRPAARLFRREPPVVTRHRSQAVNTCLTASKVRGFVPNEGLRTVRSW